MNDFESLIMNLEAVNYNKLSGSTKVFRLNDTSYFLWIKLPVEETRGFKIIEIIQSECARGCNKDCICLKELPSTFYEKESEQWLKINFESLDKKIGKHIYRISFLNELDDVIYLYFSYIIQDNDPKKPYVYMNRSNQTCGGEDLA